jgi:hypothetical protein
MAKSAIITEDWVDGKKVYALNPNMKLGSSYWDGLNLIDVEIAAEEAYRRRKIALSLCYRYVIGIPIVYTINNSIRIPNSLSVNKRKSIDNGYPCDDCENCPLKDSYLSLFSSLSAENADNDQKQLHETLQGTDKCPNKSRYEAKPIADEGDKTTLDHVAGIQTDLERAAEEDKKRADKFKTPSKVRWTEDQPKDCGSCPVALKGDKSVIKCDPCIFIGRAEA